MTKVKPCPQCKEVPIIGYCCGEHFVMTLKAPVGACVCSSFTEMHSSEETEIKAWNKHVEEMLTEVFEQVAEKGIEPVLTKSNIQDLYKKHCGDIKKRKAKKNEN